MNTGKISAYGHKDLIARNTVIVTAVLNGDTLSATARRNGLTPERIRQVVSKYCRTANKDLYAQMPKCKTVDLEWLRLHKKAFIDAMPN